MVPVPDVNYSKSFHKVEFISKTRSHKIASVGFKTSDSPETTKQNSSFTRKLKKDQDEIRYRCVLWVGPEI